MLVLNVITGQVCAASQEALRESALVRPDNPYAASKAMAELLAVQYANRTLGGIITARSFNHTGPGQASRFFFSAIAKQFVEIEHDLRPPKLVVGDLDVKRDFTDVRDIVRAYFCLSRRYILHRPCPSRSTTQQSVLLTWCDCLKPKLTSELPSKKMAIGSQ